MKSITYTNCWNLIGFSSEAESLGNDYDEGTTFLAVDTGDIYILYHSEWHKL